jgi:uncharacterized protein
MNPVFFNNYNHKRINDPVHGTIGLSKLEVEIINTKAFQRLRNVKQLGLVNYVFPGADFTRLSHSLGVCHVTGKLFDTLKNNKILTIDDEDIRDFRLAALLHDIGHYPFSHTMEDALKNYYDNKTEKQVAESIFKRKGKVGHFSKQKQPEKIERPLKHDSVGNEILNNDREIVNIFENYDVKTDTICSIFTRKDAPKFANIISSDLDADRLDYLRRSSYCVGLPYGSVDINYLISQISIDNKENQNLCINSKALRTVDHFLLSRYFEYSQVIYHKTIAAFELILADLITYLIENKKIIDCSPDEIVKAIRNGYWHNFDDIYVYNEIRKLCLDDKVPKPIKDKAISIIERRAPKELVKIEYIRDRSPKTKKAFEEQKGQLKTLKTKLVKKFGIEDAYWIQWDNGKGFELTKIGTTGSLTISDPEKEKQTILIKNEHTKECKKIMDCNNSLMSLLSDHCLYTCRLYLLVPDEIKGNSLTELKKRISEYIDDEFPNPDKK